ncbi:hypothetical protein ANCCEY_11268 [Ancylostoma ceylanicum]|uniref:7TM GPCR serpentine receptor class x (Srx) domain-containing protein n=1 Tax=Ancylostoma ceylanicum TaxID=53326 RepID=A0A0D6LEL1_9BILA|nr:hypothetical protein ANCCEY_11268 [Ancylostoma ceylanicum]
MGAEIGQAFTLIYCRDVVQVTGEVLFIQCVVAWTFDIVVSLAHIYIQFVHKPPYIALMATIGWQLGHVFPALVYLLFNTTLQRELLLLFCRGNPAFSDRSYPVASRTFLT